MKWTLVFFSILVFYSCTKENQPPACSIIEPAIGEEIELGEIIKITASAEDPDGAISDVGFYFNGSMIGAAYDAPYSIEWKSGNVGSGNYKIRARARDDMGASTSHEITIMMVNNLALVSTHQVGHVLSTEVICGGIVTGEGGDGVSAKGVCWSTEASPTLENAHTTDGSGMGEFSSNITDLIPQTDYYFRAYATNSFGTGYGKEVEFTTGTREPDPVVDIDGNSYKTVRIGVRIWMAENLRVVHYADGTPIPLVTDQSEWVNLGDNDVDKAYCWHNNDSVTYAKKYGALYTYAAAVNGISSEGISVTQGVCPEGWHLPSLREWELLLEHVRISHEGSACMALKSTSGWSDMGNGTDDYGFNALPGGRRDRYSGVFLSEGSVGHWWNSDQHFNTTAYYFYLNSSQANANSGSTGRKSDGLSVRCIMYTSMEGQ